MSLIKKAVIGAVAVVALAGGLTDSAAAATPTPPPVSQSIVVPLGYAAAPAVITAERGRRGQLVTLSVHRGAHGSVTTHVFYTSVYLDAYLSGKVIAGIGGSGVVAVVAKELGRVAWPLAVAIAALGVELKLCQHQNNSTTLDFAAGNLGIWWCS